MSKAHQYVVQSLAGAGFALVDAEIAFTLRPDLWHDAIQAGGDLREAVDHHAFNGLVGVAWGVAHIEGLARPIPVVTRSTHALAQRIEWIVGRKVAALEHGQAPAPKVVESVVPAQARAQADWRLAAVRRTAAKPLPAHDCVDRKEIPRAWRELAAMALPADDAALRDDILAARVKLADFERQAA